MSSSANSSTKSIINELEEFIDKNEPSKDYPAISCRDLANGKNVYKRFMDITVPIAEVFGSDTMGFTMYIMYKSFTKETPTIYVFTYSVMNNHKEYVTVPDENWFL